MVNNLYIFFFENCAVDEIMRKNTVKSEWPRIAMKRGACGFSCWITKAADTLRICNRCCFSPATVVTRLFLNVTL